MNMFDGTGPHPCTWPPPAAAEDHFADAGKAIPDTATDVVGQGSRQLYHADQINRCPLCRGTSWLVGRITAECSRKDCAAALPLAEGTSSQ